MTIFRRLFRDSTVRMFAKMLCIGSLAGAVFFAIVYIVGESTCAQLYNIGGLHPQTWKEFVFTIAGGLDAAPDADTVSVLYSSAIRLLATILVGGLVTSLFCALAERIGDMRLNGLLPNRLKGHYVVMGMGQETAELIRTLLRPPPENDLADWNPSAKAPVPRRRRILVCTSTDVEDARVALSAALPGPLFSRVSFVSGTISAERPAKNSLFRTLCLQYARQLYILDEPSDSPTSTISRLSFARDAVDYLNEHRPFFGTIPIHVQISGDTPFETYRSIGGNSTDALPASHIIPISISEGWSRRIWGNVRGDAGFVPDFASLSGNRYVHIVIVGLSDMGYAMLYEAIRVCHFANGAPTRITIVDPAPASQQRFRTLHPSLHLLSDIQMTWMEDRLESESVRNVLRNAAKNDDCLLSIAICIPDEDEALAAALSLPEEIYYHRMEAKPKTIRDRYRMNAPRILVRQQSSAVSIAVSDNPKFQLLRAFGTIEDGFYPEAIRESSAMLVNAVYGWPANPLLQSLSSASDSAAKRIAEFTAKWEPQLSMDHGRFMIPASERIALLNDVLAQGGEPAQKIFRASAYRDWIALPSELRRANVYAPDGWGVLLRTLGLSAKLSPNEKLDNLIPSNNSAFRAIFAGFKSERSLTETEHRRWMADRLLLGYRPPRPDSGEIRDDAFLYHPDIVPFSRLSRSDADKDDVAILAIPIILAMQGLRITTDVEH